MEIEKKQEQQSIQKGEENQDKHQMDINIDLGNEKYASIVKQVLEIDEDISSGYGTLEREISYKGQILQLNFKSTDPKKIRVAISSFMENLKLILRTIKTFP